MLPSRARHGARGMALRCGPHVQGQPGRLRTTRATGGWRARQRCRRSQARPCGLRRIGWTAPACARPRHGCVKQPVRDRGCGSTRAGTHESCGTGHCTRDAGRVHARERLLVAGMRILRRRACRMRPMPGNPFHRRRLPRVDHGARPSRCAPRPARDVRIPSTRNRDTHGSICHHARSRCGRIMWIRGCAPRRPDASADRRALPSHRRGAVPAPPDRARDMPSTRQRPVSSVPTGVSRRARGGRASGAPARSMRASRVRPARRHHVRRC